MMSTNEEYDDKMCRVVADAYKEIAELHRVLHGCKAMLASLRTMGCSGFRIELYNSQSLYPRLDHKTAFIAIVEAEQQAAQERLTEILGEEGVYK